MSVSIESARCLWLKSYLTGRIERIRIGDAISRDIRVTSGVSQGVILDHICLLMEYIVDFLRRWYEAIPFFHGFSGLYENLDGAEQTVRVVRVREKFIVPYNYNILEGHTIM
jgi:hypothetical protein